MLHIYIMGKYKTLILDIQCAVDEIFTVITNLAVTVDTIQEWRNDTLETFSSKFVLFIACLA